MSKPVKLMAVNELKMAVTRLLLKINVITGWSLHSDPESERILSEQFELKLTESYPNVNLDEIEYAFRNNPTVKDWGKVMNLALIDEVMQPYLAKRREVSVLEESLIKPKELPAPEEEVMTDEEFIQTNYGIWKTLQTHRIISIKVYTILVAQGKINLTQAEKDAMYEKAHHALLMQMNTEKENEGELRQLYKSLNPNHWKARVFNECKRIAVQDYFNKII